MPGRLYLTRPLGEMAEALGLTGLPDDPPRANIAPGQDLTILTGEGVARARWGIIPVGRVNARGRPVMDTIVNARSETVFDKSAFAGVRRAVVPVDGWYEWTGEARRKEAWRISRTDGAPILFAAIYDVWKAPGGQEVIQVATVTCAPNADVAPIHHRMGVILAPEQIADWMGPDEEKAAQLMQPLENGLLGVEPASDVDWSGA